MPSLAPAPTAPPPAPNPQVLTIVLNRTRQVRDSKNVLRTEKASDAVAFPAVGLDLSEFEEAAVEAWRGSADGHPVPPGVAMYDAFAVIAHLGASSKEGHYVAVTAPSVTRHRHEPPPPTAWYLFNDANVTAVDEAFLQRIQPYALMYRRRRHDDLSGDVGEGTMMGEGMGGEEAAEDSGEDSEEEEEGEEVGKEEMGEYEDDVE